MDDGGIDLGIEGVSRAEEIGRGGFAAVYRAVQPDFHRDVAVKVIVLPSLDEAARHRFRRECQAIGRLSGHPNIVAVHQSGFTAAGLPFLIMDYVPKGSYEDALAQSGPLPWEIAAGIGVKMAKTLDYAHRLSILHRDVKPANILISNFGEPLLADFGIAWAIDTSRGSASAVSSGTPAYAPPETWTDQDPTRASDIYSLGATMHALITGRPPFGSDTGNLLRVIVMVAEERPPDLRPLGVPDGLASAIEWAMAKEPGDRPHSAQDFAAAIEASLAGAGSSVAATRPVLESPVGDRPAAPGPGRPAGEGASTAVGSETVTETVTESGPGRGRIRHRYRAIAIVALVALLGLGAAVKLRPRHAAVPEGPALLLQPSDLTIDGSGNVYVADTNNARVVKVAPGGAATTVAGAKGRTSGANGDGGPATAAVLNSPQGLTLDGAGDLFIVEGGQDIREVGPNGMITTVAVHVPGAGQNSISAQAVVVDPNNRLVADTGTDIVRIAPDGSVEVLAGTGTPDFGGDGKPAIQAKLNSPHALAYSPSGELYVADSANNRVRKIATDGTIVTVAGPGGATLGDGGLATDASLLYPTGLAFDAQGNLYIAENGGNRLRRVDAGSGVIHTLAGSPNGDGGFAGDGGMATKALLRGPGAIAVSATGDIYVTDVNNNRVRRIAPDGTITTVA